MSALMDYCEACGSYYMTVTEHSEYCDGMVVEGESEL